MKSKIAGITVAAALAGLMASGPSFGQGMTGPSPGGSAPPPAAAPAPSGPAPMVGGGGGGGRQNVAPQVNRGGGMIDGRGGGTGGRGMIGSGGGSNRQAWSGHHYRGGYRGGYGGGGYGSGIYFGGGPYWGGPYAYDDNYYVDAPVAAGGDAAYCMRRYRSYDPRSGTYLGFDGLRHPCP